MGHQEIGIERTFSGQLGDWGGVDDNHSKSSENERQLLESGG